RNRSRSKFRTRCSRRRAVSPELSLGVMPSSGTGHRSVGRTEKDLVAPTQLVALDTGTRGPSPLISHRARLVTRGASQCYDHASFCLLLPLWPSSISRCLRRPSIPRAKAITLPPARPLPPVPSGVLLEVPPAVP